MTAAHRSSTRLGVAIGGAALAFAFAFGGLALGCGSDSGDSASSPDGGRGAGSTGGRAGAGAAANGGDGAGDRGGSAGDDAPRAGAGAAAGGGASSGEDGGATAEPPLWEAHIRSDVYRKLVIEVDVTRGFAPESGVLDQVFAGFAALLDKPDGIEVVLDDADLEPVGETHAWDFEALSELAEQTMDLELAPDVDRIHVLWIDGHDESDGDNGAAVLGLAWGHRQIAMYKQTLSSGCDQLLPALAGDVCRDAEIAVLTHEVGHVIGLVDNGLPMIRDHRDPDHGHHDISQDSVMYWAHENDSLFDTLLERVQGGADSALGFDDNCLADIAAVRDR